MTITQLKKENLILLECISGSRAYGLDSHESDTDVRGVFFLPRRLYFGLDAVGQVSNETNDESYTEVGRFFELLVKSNPTMIELLSTPKDSMLQRHPFFNKILKEYYLSLQCKDAFAGYAITQIRKAKGLNKKIHNPLEKERKSVLDFCFVPQAQGAIAVKDYLSQNNLMQQYCGLAKIPHMHDTYGLYYDDLGAYSGIIQKENANEVALSSISKSVEPLTIMSFNKSGYSTYCKEYKEYWEWVEKRNDERYKNTMSHGKNYDAKNMMHTFRLLNMAQEIAEYGDVIVRRPDREFLLSIKSGVFEYEDLLMMAEEKIEHMKETYDKCNLPESPDIKKLNDLLVEFREELYL